MNSTSLQILKPTAKQSNIIVPILLLRNKVLKHPPTSRIESFKQKLKILPSLPFPSNFINKISLVENNVISSDQENKVPSSTSYRSFQYNPIMKKSNIIRVPIKVIHNYCSFQDFNNSWQAKIIGIIRRVDDQMKFTQKYSLLSVPSFTIVCWKFAINYHKFEMNNPYAIQADIVIREFLKSKNIPYQSSISDFVKKFINKDVKNPYRSCKGQSLFDIRQIFINRIFKIYPVLRKYELEIERFDFGKFLIVREIDRLSLAIALIAQKYDISINNGYFVDYDIETGMRRYKKVNKIS